jgi:hypothetical protein
MISLKKATVALNYASTSNSDIYASKKLCVSDPFSVTLTQVVPAKLARFGPTTRMAPA